jgi:hypothetical protein
MKMPDVDVLKAVLGQAMNTPGGLKSENKKPQSLEAEIAELEEVAAAHLAANPFKVGDLVTPRPNSSINSNGAPHIVLEVLETPIRTFTKGDGDHASSGYGQLLDVRVLHMADDGNITAHWLEHGSLIPFNQDTSSQA